MKVKALIEKLRKLEDAEDCEVFVVTRSGSALEPTFINTEQGAVYPASLSMIGRCVVLDTYAPWGKV